MMGLKGQLRVTCDFFNLHTFLKRRIQLEISMKKVAFLISIIKKNLNKIGIDGAIFYASLARGFQGISGFVSLFFVVKYLTNVEQGFYYTFASVLAIQVFFELGLSGIITQYAAHEMVGLNWTNGRLQGEEKNLSRLSSLLRFCVKWYAIAAVFLFIILQIIGYQFFQKFGKHPDIIWKMPWTILVFSTSISLFINPILSFIQGLGLVKSIEKIRFILQLANSMILWTLLVFGAKLYASAICSVITLIVLTITIIVKFRSTLIPIWKQFGSFNIDFKKEIFPYQWKIALSWISGYFIFQLFNPVLFATEGATVAGQMGITLAVLNGILTLSISWVTTKVPMFSGLIAGENFTTLDNAFKKITLQSTIINFLGVAFFLFMVIGFRFSGLSYGNRFLPFVPLFCMSVAIIINHIVGSLAIYLRCHKKEPFLIFSIVTGILCSLSTLILGKKFGVTGMTSGYLAIVICTSFWAFQIFQNKRVEWHGKPM